MPNIPTAAARNKLLIPVCFQDTRIQDTVLFTVGIKMFNSFGLTGALYTNIMLMLYIVIITK